MITSTAVNKVGAIVVAAGSSARMSGVDKIFTELSGRPLICYSIEALEQCELVEHIVVVFNNNSLKHGQLLARQEGWKKVVIVSGGSRRQDSVLAGLDALPKTEWVIVHDGARPCVDKRLFEQGLDQARSTGAAVAGVPVNDTIKLVAEDLSVISTPDRRRVWSVQTPQVFSTKLLNRAHAMVKDDVTDDAAMVERLGATVQIYMGAYSNIKVTTAIDLAVVKTVITGSRATIASDSDGGE